MSRIAPIPENYGGEADAPRFDVLPEFGVIGVDPPADPGLTRSLGRMAEALDGIRNAAWHVEKVYREESTDPDVRAEMSLVEQLPAAEADLSWINFTPDYEHGFTVGRTVARTAGEIYAAATQDQALRRIHGLVEAKAPEIRQHLMRTMKAGIVLALESGLSRHEAYYIALAQGMDDAGKVADGIMKIALSKTKFEDDRAMQLAMQRHPYISVWLMREAGAHPIATVLAGNHHSRQPKGREPYTVFPGRLLLHDEHGRAIDVDRLLQYMQLTDMTDALVRPAGASDPHRAYRDDQPGSYEWAARLLVNDEVPVDRRVMDTLLRIMPAGQPVRRRDIGGMALRTAS